MISIIIVTYNSETTLRKCLDSIPHECEVVVVDQCSTDGSVALASAHRPEVKLIRAGANRGFGAGCNLGAANAEGEVLIFLNPDAYFMSADTPSILAQRVVSSNVIAGPRILDAYGCDQTRARYWSSVISELGEVFLPEVLVVGRFRRDIPMDHEVYLVGGAVPYIQGCCMAISALNFWQVSGFDERLFLYREEETLALSLRELGVSAWVEPRAAITHVGAASTNQIRAFSASQYYRSLALFFYIRHRKPLAHAATLVLWILLNLMAALTPIRILLGHRSQNNFQWYRAAAAGASSGWRRRYVEPPTAR